jgi:hypothetical protein
LGGAVAERNYNIALNAQDGFSGAFRNLVAQMSIADGAAMKLQTVLRGLGALGVAGGVGIFAGLLRDVVKAGEELNGLATTTSLTVEELSRIKDVARESGTAFDQVTGAVIKFQRALDDAREGNAEASLAFRMLGIDATDGSIKTANGLDLVATRLLQMEDGVLKNNIAMQLFGRTGAELNEFLTDYATRTERAARISTEMAENNEKLERGWRSLKNSIMDSVEALGQWIARAAGATFDFFAKNDLDLVLKRQKELREEIDRLSDPSRLNVYERIYAPDKLARAQAELTSLNAKQIDLNKQLGIISYSAENADQNSRKLFQGVVLKADEARAATAKVKEETLKLGAAFKMLELPPPLKEMKDLTAETVLEINRQTSAIVTQAETLGMTTAELIDYQIAQLEARKASQLLIGDVDKINAAYDQQIAALRLLKDANAQQDSMRAAKEAGDAALRAWQDVAGFAQGFFEDLLNNGSSAFKNLWENFKRMAISALAQIAARQLVISIGGSFAGPASGAASSLLGGGGGGFGDLLSGGGTLASLFSGGSGALSAGLSTFAGNAALSLGASASTALSAAGVAGMIGTALPWVGGALLLAQAFGLFDRGGPKSGGSASVGADLDLNALTSGTIGRLFTPNNDDSNVQKVVDAMGDSFLSIARGLGLSSGGAQFALGFDTDPEGDAGSRVSAQAMVDGRVVYNVADRDIGRDGDVTAELQLEAKRALFAALQASDLPTYLADLLSGLDAASASADQIDDILATAGALRVAVDAVSGLGAQFAAMDPAQIQQFVEAFGGLDNVLASFGFIAENFYTDAQKLTENTAALADGFAALGIEVPDTHQAFLDLLNSLDLTTAEGREMYAAISALAPLFVAVEGTAQDAADALGAAADTLDEVAEAARNVVDVGSITSGVRAEFDRIMSSIGGLVGSLAGSFGDRLGVQIQLIGDEIARQQGKLGQVLAGSAEYQAILEVIDKLGFANQDAAAQLARFTILAAQFDDERAEELVALEQWYVQQQKLFAGNSTALAALAKTFGVRWKEIVDGVAGGVDGTIDELARLRASLRDYLDKLVLREVSPLSPTAKLSAAQAQFQALLGRAQGGDVDALRDIQGAADAYLQIARQLYASGPEFMSVWQSVIDSLSAIAAPPASSTAPMTVIADAMPQGSPLASQADIAILQELLARLIAETRAAADTQAVATARSAEKVAVAARPLK